MIESNSERKKQAGSGKVVQTLSNASGGRKGDKETDTVVRPAKIDEIVGRATEKKKVMMMINASQKRGEVVDHMLFYGPPGLGKTTFAMAIANEVSGLLHVTSGPAIRKQGDLATLMTSLAENDVLFIDEIHRLARGVEEILYPAMEDRKIDVVVGKGVSAKTLRLNLKPFTLIGATTRIGLISSPMRDRFGLVQHLEYFEIEDLKEILNRASVILGVACDSESLREIAVRSRGTARVALRILRRIRDYQDSYVDNDLQDVGNGRVSDITLETVLKALRLLDIDDLGLEVLDRKILTVMLLNYAGGPVGLSTLAASVSEDATTIADVYEPFLMKCGFLKRTSRGRVLTTKGGKYAEKLLES